MKRTTVPLTIFAVTCILSPVHVLPQESCPTIQSYFSPHGGATQAIIRALDIANNTALVQAYSFTSAPIAKALLNAHKRGVKVEVILDKSQRKQSYSSATFVTMSEFL